MLACILKKLPLAGSVNRKHYLCKKRTEPQGFCPKSCRRPESNRYGYHYPRDFKSRASASSATTARDAQTVSAKSIRALHCLFNLASMGGGGFEPPKQIAADLQSVPFGHSGIHPFCLSTISIYIINKEKAQGNLSNSPALFPNFYTQNDHAAFI